MASGQALDLFPIAGTGAYHVNPISGRCLFGKLKDGSCRLQPRPKFKTTAYLNLPPERGPPDANGYRSEAPVKFPKALISVAGERQRVKGDSAFRQMVKDKMGSLAALMARLQKVRTRRHGRCNLTAGALTTEVGRSWTPTTCATTTRCRARGAAARRLRHPLARRLPTERRRRRPWPLAADGAQGAH